VRDGETGILVEPEDSEGLKIAIGKIVGDPDLRKRLSSNARKWAADNSLKISIDTLEALYSAIVEHKQ